MQIIQTNHIVCEVDIKTNTFHNECEMNENINIRGRLKKYKYDVQNNNIVIQIPNH